MSINVAELKRTTQEAAERKYTRLRDGLCTFAQQQIREASEAGNWECQLDVSDEVIATVGMVGAKQILEDFLPPELNVCPGYARFEISWSKLKDDSSM